MYCALQLLVSQRHIMQMFQRHLNFVKNLNNVIVEEKLKMVCYDFDYYLILAQILSYCSFSQKKFV